MDFITNETQINNPADIVTSLDKRHTAKVYEYLVTVDAKNKTDEKPDLELLLSKYRTR